MSFKQSTHYLLIFCVLIFYAGPSFAQKELSKQDTIISEQKEAASTISQRLMNTGMVAQSCNEGMGMSLRIRGAAILNISSNPLIVVNGVPYQTSVIKGFDFTTASERDYAALIGIPQEDIKEIAILQDATSAAQFGSRAANGVILITTKRGSTGKPTLNYRFEESIRSQPRGYDMLSGPQYTTLMEEAYANSYGVSMPFDSYPEFANDPSKPSNYYNYGQNTDWIKEITRTSLTRDHYLSLSGGFKKLDYNVSAGYLTQKGITLGSGQQRFTTRLALDYYISDRLKISGEMSYVHSSVDVNYQPEGSIPFQELALKKMPNMSIYEIDANGNTTSNYFNPIDNSQGSGYTWYNPVAMANLSHDNNKNNRITPTFALSYKALKELNYNFYIAYDGSFDKRNAFDPKELISNSNSDFVTLSDNHTDIVQTQNQFVFTPRLSTNHALMAVASFNTFATTNHANGSSNDYTSNDGFSYQSNFKNYFSFFRINYQLYSKYLLDITGREEWNSVLGSSFKDHFYPSATLQWLASKENLMKSFTFIDDLIFRASYGENSNANWADPAAFMLEKLKKEDLGVNIVLFKSSINVDFNLYKRLIKDQVQPVIQSIPPSTLETLDNVNRGWEFSVIAKIVKSRNFSVDFSFDLYRNRNVITRIPPSALTGVGNPYINGSYTKRLDLNTPTGSFYGYRYQGVYTDDEDAIAKDRSGNLVYDGNGTPVYMKNNVNYIFKGGDARYADINYDGIINSADIVYLGDANPSFTGSAGPSLRYKGWWLGIYFNFRTNNKIMNLARMDLEKMYNFDNQSTTVLQRWRKPGDVTDIPAANLNSRYNYLGSDRFMEDGSFLRLKVLTLKYQFSTGFIKKLHLNDLAFYVSCRNIMTFTHYSGADPEIAGYGGWQDFGYDGNFTPQYKEFIFGINIGI